MADTDTESETTNEQLAPASPPSDPTQDNTTQTADADALKTQLQKLEMERNMLRKQKDALEKAQAERDRKELEEKEDFRSLAERAQAEAEALRKEKEEAETQAATQAATADVYKDFPTNVIEIAKTAGLTASNDTEEAKSLLKTKLEAIQQNVGSGAPVVGGSNPAPPQSETTFDSVRVGKLMRVDDRNLREPAIKEAIGRHPQVQQFREFAKQANRVQPQSS